MNINGKSYTTLFLDRDGVINKDIYSSYVLQISQFEFLEGVLQAMPLLKNWFKQIIVVTNQRCIEKGLISHAELGNIHDYMMQKIQENGGRIDAIFYSPYSDNNHPMRKPNNGMAWKAKELYENINFEESIMVGNMPTDLQFGHSLGMYTVYIDHLPLGEEYLTICSENTKGLLEWVKKHANEN